MSTQAMPLGSLFDGSGGFPLAATRHGIQPVWASEVEPFPIRVTRKHFPSMKHLGDIYDVNGAEIEPVDIISGSSPCQSFSVNASVHGYRTGLEGKSGLFSEMIRIISEMRAATHNRKPRYIIWENVTGALSANKGDDFHTIIQNFFATGATKVTVPRPHKWTRAGCAVGDAFNLAWRTVNSQFWGLPANRPRVYLVGCFTEQRGGVNRSLNLRKYSLTPGMAQYVLRALKKRNRTIPNRLTQCLKQRAAQ